MDMLHAKNNIEHLTNQEDANTIIKKLSKYNIERLLIEEVSLEDLFSSFYK